MNKLRSDSAFCQLTPEQVEALEGWLFEERLGYPKVVEKLKAEFGLETSLSGVRRFYKRLDMERSRVSLVDVVEMSAVVREALKRGSLKPGMLALANKCAFELMMQPREDWCVREITALMRAITSAEAGARKQTDFEREEKERQERERLRKVRESWELTPADIEQEKEELRQERAARKKAKQAAAELQSKASSGGLDAAANLPTPHPGPLPVERRGNKDASAASIVSDRPRVSDPPTPRGTSGKRAGERGSSNPTYPSGADDPVKKDADAAWQPNVLEQPEYVENYVPDQVEHRLTPLNAA
jgi:hypothetical protein